MTAKKASDVASMAVAYQRFGVTLGDAPNLRGQHVGDCPFCDKEGKFFVDPAEGLYQCKVCGGKGNLYTFLQKLHEMSGNKPADGKALDKLCEDRRLLSPKTLSEWGVRRNLLNDEWMVPGYNVGGKVSQLYRLVYDKKAGKSKLYATPGLGHQLFLGGGRFDERKSTVYVCEGVWDAMALWEMLGKVRYRPDGGLALTSNSDLSLLSDANVVGIPGAHVFNETWLQLFEGKLVTFMAQNDHPRYVEKTQQTSPPASLEGIKRVVAMMPKHGKPPQKVSYLCWGDEGFTMNLESGYDIRDALGEAEDLKGKVARLQGLMDSIRPVPREWVTGGLPNYVVEGSVALELKECTSFEELEKAWRKAFKWSEGLSRALSCMLACSVSTKQQGDQLWMKIIGPPSSGKTVLCEALSANSRYCISVSNMRGFHSGYKTDKDGLEDHSLIEQVKDKTMITKDGDTLLQSPNRDQILAEARDLYDKSSSAFYRHGIQRKYAGLQFTWLLCGTEAMRSLDTSELGERFLDCVVVDQMPKSLERSISRHKSRLAFQHMALESNGKADSHDGPEMVEAKRLTGGYVSYLRENSTRLFEKLVGRMEESEEQLDEISYYAEFVSYMRSRPSPRQREKAQRELCIRLTSQLTRLAACLAVVLNRETLDEEVMRRVRRVALDTARGRVLQLVQIFHENETDGVHVTDTMLSSQMGEKPEQTKDLLLFLRKIGVVELYDANENTKVKHAKMRYRLTKVVNELFPKLVKE